MLPVDVCASMLRGINILEAVNVVDLLTPIFLTGRTTSSIDDTNDTYMETLHYRTP